ncbi:MAG TPA: FUSC family protein [Gemmatimonadaceae bacterium]|jgi:hypothetical protein|nr:FUSC family protein [Gemmatimonadaceae bacterium]
MRDLGAPRPLARRVRDRVLAADPGRFGLRTALRASISLAVSAILLYRFGAPLGSPLLLAIVGGEVAMMSSSSVSDATLGAQRVTLLLAVLASIAAVGLAALVSLLPSLAVVVLCALVFLVVLARKIGPRGMAVGLLAFMGYFLALYVGARPAQLPGLVVAILVGGAVAYVVHFRLVRERPEEVRDAVLRAFRARVMLLLDEVAVDAASGSASSRRWRRIRRGTGRVGEVALALERAVGRVEGVAPEPPIRGWVSALLHAEVAVDMLVEAAHRLASRTDSRERHRALARMVRALQPWIDDGDERARDEARRLHRLLDAARGAERQWAEHPELWWRLSRAMATLTAGRPWSAFPPIEPGVAALPVGTFRAGGGGVAGVQGMSPDLRLAIQATVAVALSVVAGRLISGERWYWAVLAAFVVFVRATTVGETMSRAWQRIFGTVIGVAIGLAVARLVGRHPVPASVVGLAAIFLAYYLMRIAYTGMIACFTIALALLYSEMGRATAGLMELRLLETLAGATIGVVVSAVVLPAHSESRVRVLAARVLRAATSAIERATTPGVRAEHDDVLHDRIRDVDRALAELRNALRPLWGPNLPLERTVHTRPGRVAAGLAYATRRLATTPLSDTGERGALLRCIGERIVANGRASADALEWGGSATAEPIFPLVERLQALETDPVDVPRIQQALSLLGDMAAIERELVEIR